MVVSAWRRGAQRDGHFQRADRQIPFEAITDGPADNAPGAQVQDHRQIPATGMMEIALPGGALIRAAGKTDGIPLIK